MPRAQNEVAVNPKVMRWLRESAGYSTEEVAKRVSSTPQAVDAWETGQRKPTARILRELAKYYKRPLGAFLLSEPPEEPPPPSDFRSVFGKDRGRLSPKTLRIVRWARRIQENASDLASEMGLGRRRLPTLHAHTMDEASAESLADKQREEFGVSLEEQESWPNKHFALNEWRRRLGDRGVLVLQASMPNDDARGFSLAGEQNRFPIVVVNSKDDPHGRIFTLFHELAHILIGRTGICNPSVAPVAESERHTHGDVAIETFCNRFAGRFLVPDPLLRDVPTMRSAEEAARSCVRLSGRLKVSRHVVLLRLLHTGRVSLPQYRRALEGWGQWIEPSGKGGPPPEKVCISRNGPDVISLVLNASERGVISTNDALEMLSTKLEYLPRIRRELATR